MTVALQYMPHRMRRLYEKNNKNITNDKCLFLLKFYCFNSTSAYFLNSSKVKLEKSQAFF